MLLERWRSAQARLPNAVDLAMSEPHAHLQPLSLSLAATFALIITALFYLRGWLHLRRAFPNLVPVWRLAAFMGGLFSVWTAVASPLAALDHQSLTIHMVKHLLLMTVAAPLVLAGAPWSLLHGMPRCFIQNNLLLGNLPRWRSNGACASCVVLAGGHCRRDRMASSRCVSTGHAVPLGT